MSMMVGARSTQSCEINVTPLIDVLLVLLIIFMVVLPEHKWGEKTLVPQPSADATLDDEIDLSREEALQQSPKAHVVIERLPVELDIEIDIT